MPKNQKENISIRAEAKKEGANLGKIQEDFHAFREEDSKYARIKVFSDKANFMKELHCTAVI